MKRALAIRERVLGEQHPDTALSLTNLGALQLAQGELAGARSYYERALVICEKQLGSQHPTSMTVRKNLAALDAPQPTADQQIAEIEQQVLWIEERARWAEADEPDGSP